MRRPLTDRDPCDETDVLFDPATTLPKTCSCGQTRRNLCPIDAAITNGGAHKWAVRPRTCLTRYDPAEGRIPF